MFAVLTEFEPKSSASARENKENGLVPTISMFYGIIVSLFFVDNKQRHAPQGLGVY